MSDNEVAEQEVQELFVGQCKVCGGDLVRAEGGCSMATVDAYCCLKCGNISRIPREQEDQEEDLEDALEMRITTADVDLPIHFTV